MSDCSLRFRSSLNKTAAELTYQKALRSLLEKFCCVTLLEKSHDMTK